MLTFDEWLKRYGPRERAFYAEDVRLGWDAAMRELMVREWEFRVILPPTVNSEYNRSDWHVIPFICIKPMLDLFAAEIELRPVYVGRGTAENGIAVLARLNNPSPIPF